MTKREIENEITDLQNRIEKRLEKQYSFVARDGKKVFLLDETETVSIVCVRLNENDPFFIVEYGNGDDGDRYYPSEYQDPEKLIDAILAEIQEESENGKG